MADTVSSTILHLWSSSTHCDLLLLIGNRRYYAHSFILTSVCRLVREKSTTTVPAIYRLTLSSRRGLELLLIYLYTSRLILNVYTVADLLLAASELDVEHVVQQCVRFIDDTVQQMHNGKVQPSLLWAYLVSCLQISKVDIFLRHQLLEAIRHFYPKIISSKYFLRLTSEFLIRIFDLLITTNIPSHILLDSLLNWVTYNNQQTIIEQLVLRYIHFDELSSVDLIRFEQNTIIQSNKKLMEYIHAMKNFHNYNNSALIENEINKITFNGMEEKLDELIQYQKKIIERFVTEKDSLELVIPPYCLIPCYPIGVSHLKDDDEPSSWITEAEETTSLKTNDSCHWQSDNRRITMVAVCCTSTRSRTQINRDFDDATRAFTQFDSSHQQYALVHAGERVYAISNATMLKFDVNSRHVQPLDSPKPGRSQFGLATDTRRIVLVGGLISSTISTLSTIMFECQQEQWFTLPDVPMKYQQGILAPGACFLDHSILIIVAGSILTSQGLLALRKCYQFHLSDRKWISIAPCNEARDQPIVTCYAGMIYAIGGRQYIYDQHRTMTSINVISIEQYNIHTNQWTLLTTINQLRFQTNLYCTSDGVLIGNDKLQSRWSYDLIKRRLTRNFGLSG